MSTSPNNIDKLKSKAGELSKRYKGHGSVKFGTWLAFGILCSMSISTDLNLLSDITFSKINDKGVMLTSLISIMISLAFIMSKYDQWIAIVLFFVIIGKFLTLVDISLEQIGENDKRKYNLVASIILNCIIFIILLFISTNKLKGFGKNDMWFGNVLKWFSKNWTPFKKLN